MRRYVPTLVEQIDKHGGINLKGFMVGNGIIGHRDTFPGASRVYHEFLHVKAFISESLWADMVAQCGDQWDLPGQVLFLFFFVSNLNSILLVETI